MIPFASKLDALPLLTRTPASWAESVLQDPLRLLADHALLEKKAAANALEMLGRWPTVWLPGWVETMTSVARDEAAHLAQVTRILLRRGGRLTRGHSNPYASALRKLVRNGTGGEVLDRLLVSALIEARSCERFAALAPVAAQADNATDLAALYNALFASEWGHYKVFLRLAGKVAKKAEVDARWREMLEAEARIIGSQEPGPRIHSGLSATKPAAALVPEL